MAKNERILTMNERVRLDEITESLRVRLRSVCADWPEDMFEDVVRELASITLKYEGSATPTQYDRRRTDLLVADLREVIGRSQKRREPTDQSPEP